MEMIKQLKNNPYVYTFISKIQGYEKVLDSLNKLTKIKENSKKGLEEKNKE